MKKYYRKGRLKSLFACPAYNTHVLNIAYALEEAGILEGFYTPFVDSYSSRLGRRLRKFIGKRMPFLDKILKKRRIEKIPAKVIFKDPFREILRFTAAKFCRNKRISDFFWEKGEHYLDRQSAKLVKREEFNLFAGIEHGCLAALTEAKKTGKKTVLFFLSPHHSFFKKWVITEYDKFPKLMDAETKELIKLSAARDRRRDKEARLADIICTNSKLVTTSLIEAGFSEKKIITVPLGAPQPNFQNKQIARPKKTFRFIYAGSFSVHKGAHYLLKAWDSLGNTDARLYIYGQNLIPKRLLARNKKNIYFHEPVNQKYLFANFKKSDVLVFPALCDGFGMVAFEAMAQGLPVITTKNAGVSQFIQDGRNGLLVPPADSQALANKMLWCMDNPGKVYQMRKEALKTAKSRGWEGFQKDFMKKLKQKLINEKET